MVGIVLSDSFLVAKAVAECRVRDRRWSGMPSSARRRGRRVASPLHSSGAAVCVMLDGEVSPTVAGNRLIASSTTDANSRRPGCCTMILAKGRFFVPPDGRFGTAAGFMLLGGRVKELLDALRHVATLVALELV